MSYNNMPRRPSWWSQLSEGSKAIVIAACITGVFTLVAAIIGLLHISNSRSGGNVTSSSSSASALPASNAPISPTTQTSSEPASPTPSPSPSPSPSYDLAYANKDFYINVGTTGCGGVGAYVNIDAPWVDPDGMKGGDAFDFYGEDCVNHTFQVIPAASDASGSLAGQDSPTGCLNEIESDPVTNGDDIVDLYKTFCVQSTTGALAYVDIFSEGSQGQVDLKITAWKPAS